jgi:hypothetical protein
LLYAIYGNRGEVLPIFSVETSFYHPVNEESTKRGLPNLKRMIHASSCRRMKFERGKTPEVSKKIAGNHLSGRKLVGRIYLVMFFRDLGEESERSGAK